MGWGEGNTATAGCATLRASAPGFFERPHRKNLQRSILRHLRAQLLSRNANQSPLGLPTPLAQPWADMPGARMPIAIPPSVSKHTNSGRRGRGGPVRRAHQASIISHHIRLPTRVDEAGREEDAEDAELIADAVADERNRGKDAKQGRHFPGVLAVGQFDVLAEYAQRCEPVALLFWPDRRVSYRLALTAQPHLEACVEDHVARALERGDAGVI